MNYFRSFKDAINLSRNVHYSMKSINYSDKLLNSIYKKRDIDSLSTVINLVEDKLSITKFMDLLYYRLKDEKKLLKCLFAAIEHIDITEFGNSLLIFSCQCDNLELIENDVKVNPKCFLLYVLMRNKPTIINYFRSMNLIN